MPSAPNDDVLAIGAVVRRARRRMNLSVEQLAARASVATGSVSELERGRGNPSLTTLTRLADAFGVPLVTMLASARHHSDPVVRATARTVLAPLAPDDRALRELLTPDLSVPLQVIRTVLPAGTSSEHRPFRHLGVECVHVLSGRLVVVVDGVRHELDEGDAITYDCASSHWWANPGDDECVVIGATTPG